MIPGQRESQDWGAYVETLDHEEALGELIHLAKQHHDMQDGLVKANASLLAMSAWAGIYSTMITDLVRRFDESGPVSRSNPRHDAIHSCEFLARVVNATGVGLRIDFAPDQP